jgi:hypothetical protein
MSSDANGQSSTPAGDPAASQAIGREVLQALLEIDRAIPANASTLDGAETIQALGALPAASLVCAGISIHSPGRRTTG